MIAAPPNGTTGTHGDGERARKKWSHAGQEATRAAAAAAPAAHDQELDGERPEGLKVGRASREGVDAEAARDRDRAARGKLLADVRAAEAGLAIDGFRARSAVNARAAGTAAVDVGLGPVLDAVLAAKAACVSTPRGNEGRQKCTEANKKTAHIFLPRDQ